MKNKNQYSPTVDEVIKTILLFFVFMTAMASIYMIPMFILWLLVQIIR